MGGKIKKLLKKLFFRSKNPSPLQEFLSDFARLYPEVYFVQIGANNGVTGDPIHRLVIQNQWKGVLVEPVPYLFNELKENYNSSNSDLIFEKVAISHQLEERNFYYIVDEENDLPEWAKGINSFNKDHILWQKRNYPDIAKYINEITIECIPLKELIARNSISRINLTLIDVEGYDYEILKQLDTIDIVPDVVIYEHQCLGKEKNDSQEFLRSRDFEVFETSGDTIAVKRNQDSSKTLELIEKGTRLFR